jgi:hypothetical protein
MVSFGDSKHESIEPLQSLLVVTPLKLTLSAKCTIHDVVRWPLLFLNLSISILAHWLSVRELEWDGLEGSLGIFGLRASLVGMPNVPESEGMVCVWLIILIPLQF